MRVYIITWEDRFGNEYTETYAAAGMDKELAETLAVRFMLKDGSGYPYDETDIDYVFYSIVDNVQGADGKYKVMLTKIEAE